MLASREGTNQAAQKLLDLENVIHVIVRLEKLALKPHDRLSPWFSTPRSRVRCYLIHHKLKPVIDFPSPGLPRFQLRSIRCLVASLHQFSFVFDTLMPCRLSLHDCTMQAQRRPSPQPTFFMMPSKHGSRVSPAPQEKDASGSAQEALVAEVQSIDSTTGQFQTKTIVLTT